MIKNLYVIFFIELLDNLRPVSPKSSHMERVKTPLGITNTVIEEEEQPFKERFLKITVRHITDGQVKFISQFIYIKLLFFCFLIGSFILLKLFLFLFTGCCWWSVASYAECSNV